jgi:hypothetical protein
VDRGCEKSLMDTSSDTDSRLKRDRALRANSKVTWKEDLEKRLVIRPIWGSLNTKAAYSRPNWETKETEQ